LIKKDLSIGEQISNFLTEVRSCHEKTVEILLNPSEGDSLNVLLEFPEEVKVYCEQYLVYFVQFLKDLGVEASSDIKHEAGKVLFSVTPIDKDEALDKIRAALEVYLVLPAGKLGYTSDGTIEVQRLTANVQHLQSQMTLAQVVMQQQHATIQAQQITINRLLSDNVIEIDPKPEARGDKEDSLVGAMDIAIYKKNSGVEINLPEIYRRLKRLFNEGKNK